MDNPYATHRAAGHTMGCLGPLPLARAAAAPDGPGWQCVEGANAAGPSMGGREGPGWIEFCARKICVAKYGKPYGHVD